MSLASNILQPSAAGQNCGGSASAEFMNSLCDALLHTTNNDNAARQQAEAYMSQASKSQGCLSSLLQIATNQQVSSDFSLSDQSPHLNLTNSGVQSGNPKIGSKLNRVSLTNCSLRVGKQGLPGRCEPAGCPLPQADCHSAVRHVKGRSPVQHR